MRGPGAARPPDEGLTDGWRTCPARDSRRRISAADRTLKRPRPGRRPPTAPRTRAPARPTCGRGAVNSPVNTSAASGVGVPPAWRSFNSWAGLPAGENTAKEDERQVCAPRRCGRPRHRKRPRAPRANGSIDRHEELAIPSPQMTGRPAGKIPTRGAPLRPRYRSAPGCEASAKPGPTHTAAVTARPPGSAGALARPHDLVIVPLGKARHTAEPPTGRRRSRDTEQPSSSNDALTYSAGAEAGRGSRDFRTGPETAVAPRRPPVATCIGSRSEHVRSPDCSTESARSSRNCRARASVRARGGHAPRRRTGGAKGLVSPPSGRTRHPRRPRAPLAQPRHRVVRDYWPCGDQTSSPPLQASISWRCSDGRARRQRATMRR